MRIGLMLKFIILFLFLLSMFILFPYTKVTNNFVNYQSYKDENFSRYLKLSQKTDLKDEDVIDVVNLDMDLDNVEYNSIMKDLLKEKYFIKSRYQRYVDYYNKTKYDINTVVTNVNCNLDYEYYTNTKPTDLSKNNLMLVNKYNYLSKDYDPEIIQLDSSLSVWGGLKKEAYDAFISLNNNAIKEGYIITNQSPYRRYSVQERIYNSYLNIDPLEVVDSYSARPGFSEHQTGLALDVGENFGDLNYFGSTKSFTWMKDNAHKYGFILRYPEGLEYLTGYTYEPWHYRYVGVDVATYIYENNITFDEYYAYFIEK